MYNVGRGNFAKDKKFTLTIQDMTDYVWKYLLKHNFIKPNELTAKQQNKSLSILSAYRITRHPRKYSGKDRTYCSYF